MSWVTVNVPCAPQPLACMRRSGITSRSKCANFSISQMSCRSAGPRRPAVMLLVLSATGDPVAFAPQEVAGGIRAVNLEAFIGAAVRRHQPHVVEHRAGVEQFGIELEAAALSGECAEVIDA